MKVLVLHKDGTMEVKNVKCNNKGIEVASWGILHECITSCTFNKDHSLMCISDDSFGWDIITEDEMGAYSNNYAMVIFGMSHAPSNDVVITSVRNGKACDIRKRDIKMIEEAINREKNIKQAK